jgi:hypothetical protein
LSDTVILRVMAASPHLTERQRALKASVLGAALGFLLALLARDPA